MILKMCLLQSRQIKNKIYNNKFNNNINKINYLYNNNNNFTNTSNRQLRLIKFTVNMQLIRRELVTLRVKEKILLISLLPTQIIHLINRHKIIILLPVNNHFTALIVTTEQWSRKTNLIFIMLSVKEGLVKCGK